MRDSLSNRKNSFGAVMLIEERIHEDYFSVKECNLAYLTEQSASSFSVQKVKNQLIIGITGEQKRIPLYSEDSMFLASLFVKFGKKENIRDTLLFSALGFLGTLQVVNLMIH